MTVLPSGALRIRCRATLCLILASASSGCAAGSARRPESPGASPRLLYHHGDAWTVTLRPGLIAAGSGVAGLADVRLYLGGIASLDEADAARLALVLQAARDSVASPVLNEHRRLLLEIDGLLFRSSSLVDSRLYRYALTELGYTETVLVPIDRPTLQRMGEAEAVTGRVGDWISFELSRRDLEELRHFLDALPRSDHDRARRVGSVPGWIGG